jgi:hypothetical protein
MTEKINKGGRPAITLTEEQIAQTEALGAVLSIEQIADYFGIGKTTFYAIMERQPEVSERYKRGKAKAISAVAQGLLQQARDGNTTAAMFYLKTQAGWRETQNIDHTTNGESIQPQVIEIVTPKITD